MSQPRTVHEALRAAARSRPEVLAYRVDEAEITFGELEARAARSASSLTHHGAGAGDRIAIATGTRLETLVLVHAAHWIGAAPTVLDAKLDARRIARRVASTDCCLLITTVSGGAERKGAAMTVGLAELEASIQGERQPSPPGPEQPAFLQFTSGTTGEPRAAVVSHRAAMSYLGARAVTLRVGPDDVLVTWVPLHHDLGLVMFGLGAVAFRVPVHLLQPELRQLKDWLHEIGRVGGTITASPDFGYRITARLVDPGGVDLSSLRFALVGGEPPRLSTIRAFEERFGVSDVIRPGYGLAEATLGVTSYVPDEALRIDAAGRVSCGRPLTEVGVRIVDDRERVLPVGKIGKIRVTGPQLFSGYYGDPAGTRQALADGWLCTGDVGYLDDDGHLFVLARERAMIKRAGASIAPVEVEEVVDQIESVRRSAAIGVGDGNDLVVIVEVGPKERVVGLEAKIADRVRSVVGGPPDHVRIVPPGTISLSRSGKTRYDELRQKWRAGTLGAPDGDALG